MPYDVVLMNPPFSADQAHIRKAWEALAPGGRLVAICGEGSFTGRAAREEFKEWLDEIGAYVDPLDSVSDTTNARGRLIFARKR